MAKRIQTFAPGVQVPSATLNSAQDQAASMLLAGSNNDLSVPLGVDGLLWQAASTLGTSGASQILSVDGGDWHDRMVWGWCIQNTGGASGEGAGTAGASRIGQALDYNLDLIYINTLASGAGTKPQFFLGYLGKGGWSNTAGAGTAVTPGNPPSRGTSGVTSWFVNVGANGNLCLFVDPGTYKLYLYNNTSQICQPTIALNFSAATGKRP